MPNHPVQQTPQSYPLSRSAAGCGLWEKIVSACGEVRTPDSFAGQVRSLAFEMPPFLPDLIRLEGHVAEVRDTACEPDDEQRTYSLNPALAVLNLRWQVTGFYQSQPDTVPGQNPETVLVWKDPATQGIRVKPASRRELFAVKLMAEDTDLLAAAGSGGITPGMVTDILREAVDVGLLLKPAPLIRRQSLTSVNGRPAVQEQAADAFTLQWHITQACDLHCKHCYDRSDRSPLTLDQAESVMTDFYRFCHRRFVDGHICFSGGNPFLHPDFFSFYKMASDMGFGLSLLANPVSRATLDRLMDITPSGYFQVSLEGLETHNDKIRGKGNFKRVMDFLDMLRDYPMESAVMLTLTRDNMDQVLPLKKLLDGRVDTFNFNRLACFGEGARLSLPDAEPYRRFIRDYVSEALDDPLLEFKDNLINIALFDRRLPLSDGCTGFGCGAAFNFMAILPDGDAHACRKFPSPIGNVIEQGIAAVYDAPISRQYRQGAQACSGCSLRPVCGGCMAVTAGAGKDPFRDRDPMCFFGSAP